MSTLTADLSLPPLDQNLPCLRCGYNLRTLSTTGQCPECSTPIASSLDPTLLRFADPSWTATLSLALGLMIVCAAIQVIYIPFILLLVRTTRDLWTLGTLFFKVYQFVAPLFWLGVFILGRADPGIASVARRFSLRRAMRIAALFNLLWAILPDLKSIELPIEQLLDLVGTTLMFLYLLKIAKRSQFPRLIRHTCIAMALVILSDLAIITFNVFSESEWEGKLALVLAPILAYQVFVLHLFRRTLRKSAHLARQYWHFCSPVPSSVDGAIAH